MKIFRNIQFSEQKDSYLMRALTLIFLIFSNFSLSAQSKYWVFFSPNAEGTSKCVESLKKDGYLIVSKSNLLNAAVLELNNEQKVDLKQKEFVLGLRSVQHYSVPAIIQEPPLKVPFAINQIGAEPVLKNAKQGLGIKIGVIDVGFANADLDLPLRNIFIEGRIKGKKDFVEKNRADSLFFKASTKVDFHGTLVMRNIGGFDTQSDEIYGFAKNADFYLARTDSGIREYRGEEYQWVEAIEWLSDQGVRLVNTSLGYARGFTDSTENYVPEQMNGKSSVIAMAADLAATEKNMIIIVSAGNSGESNEWPIISTPADAKNVISVGANDRSGLKMSYSSQGPEFLDYIKPEITAYSEFGTSLSAPIITGLVANMLEFEPDLAIGDLKNRLEVAGQNYPFPNNYVGYGFPASHYLFDDLENMVPYRTGVEMDSFRKKEKIGAEKNTQAILYHKRNKFSVIKQERIEPVNGKFIINRIEGDKFTTVVMDDVTYEIAWK